MSKKLFIILGLLLFIIITVLADRFLLKPDEVSTPVTKKPATMKTYQDSFDTFSVQVPSNWTIKQSSATNTTGANTGKPVKQEIKITQFFVANEMSITVQMYDGTPTCPLAKPLTTTLAGFPAAHDEALQQWSIPTTTGTFTVTTTYPGSAQTHRETQPTLPPQSTIDADKKLIEKIMSTLKLSNLKPFSC